MLTVEHVCEIFADYDIIFPPVQNYYQKIFNVIRYFMMASGKNPGAVKYLRSRLAIIAEKRRHFRNYTYIIHPFSRFRYFWDLIMVVTIMLLLLTTPYYATFKFQKRLLHWTLLKNFMLFLCCVDIVINFLTGYFDKVNHVVVMRPSAIVNRYIRHTFLPDLLGSLPTDIGFIGITKEYVFLREVVSLVCVFRAFSLNSYTFKFADAYDVSSSIYSIAILIFWIFMLIHWQSCLYWLVPIIVTSIYQPIRPHDASWIHVYELWEASESEQYLRCLLHAITIFFSSGFMRARPKSEEDLLLAIIMQFTGIVITWELIARVMLLYKGMNGAQIKYQNIIEQLKHYMRHRQLPHSQQARIISYYEYRFQHFYFSEQEILKTLSVHMRQEIRMHACRKLVENVTFFNNLPLSLLARIVSLLKSEIFLTNDVIVRANTPGDSMYFIASGTVAIYTATGKEVCHLEDGAHFGEIALVMAEEQRVASVIAIETCELYRLDRSDFSRTIHPYPMLWDRIKKIAIERHEKTVIFSG